MRLRIQFEDGEIHNWEAWRDPRHPPTWHLRTHDGGERFVGNTWSAAIAPINQCAENYGGIFLTVVS